MATFYAGQTDYLAKLNDLWDRVTGVQAVTVVGSTVTIDISSTKKIFDFTLAGNWTINLTGGSSSLDGKQCLLRIAQDATGGRVPVLGTGWHLGADVASFILSTGASKVDYAGLIYRHGSATYDLIAVARGY